MDKEIVAYRRLWRSVIMQIAMDLITYSSKPERRNRVFKTKKYILYNQEDLKIVCEYADFEFYNVLKGLKKLGGFYEKIDIKTR